MAEQDPPTDIPLTYPSQEAVMNFMNIDQRSQFKYLCPSVRELDKRVPLLLDKFTIQHFDWNNKFEIIIKGKYATDACPRHIVWKIGPEKIIRIWKNEEGTELERKSCKLVGSPIDVVNARVKYYLDRKGTTIKTLDLQMLPTPEFKHSIKVDRLEFSKFSGTNNQSILRKIQQPIPLVQFYGATLNEYVEEDMIPSAKKIMLSSIESPDNVHLLKPSNELCIGCIRLDNAQLLALLKNLVGVRRPHQFTVTIIPDEPIAAMKSLVDEPNLIWKASKYDGRNGFSIEKNGDEVFMKQFGQCIQLTFLTWGFTRSMPLKFKSASCVSQNLSLHKRQEMYNKWSLQPLITRFPVRIKNLHMKCEEEKVVSAVIDGEQFIDPFKYLKLFNDANVFVENVHVEGYFDSFCMWNPLAVKKLTLTSKLSFWGRRLNLFNREPLDTLIVASKTTVEDGEDLVNNAKHVIYLDKPAKRKYDENEEQPPNKKFKTST